MNKEEYQSSLHSQLKYNQLIATAEVMNTTKGEKTWLQQESDYSKYEQILGLKPETLTESIARARLLVQDPFVLDVGSDTACISSLGVKGVAIGLADTRSPSLRSSDETEGRYFVSGDILDHKTWNKVHEIHPKYHRIISVMEGGLKKITDKPLVHYHLLNQMWRKLDDDGEMYVQTHMKTDRYVLTSIPLMHNSRWLSYLQSHGVHVEELARGLKFVKDHNSPHSLPLTEVRQSVYEKIS